MAKIRIVAFGTGQDLNGEQGLVGVITGRNNEEQGFFFARMVEAEGRQRWLGQRFFAEEADALRYWRRRLQARVAGA